MYNSNVRIFFLQESSLAIASNKALSVEKVDFQAYSILYFFIILTYYQLVQDPPFEKCPMMHSTKKCIFV